jgi:hypothetical protein
MTLNKKKTLTMDLEGYKVNTIPLDILVTDKARPDLVLVDRSSSPNSVTIVELTIPWDGTLEKARDRKELCYTWLQTDIKRRGFPCNLPPLEIGARGLVTSRNKGTITHLCQLVGERKISKLLSNMSRLALLGSYAVWCARKSEEWTSGRLLKPQSSIQ